MPYDLDSARKSFVSAVKEASKEIPSFREVAKRIEDDADGHYLAWSSRGNMGSVSYARRPENVRDIHLRQATSLGRYIMRTMGGVPRNDYERDKFVAAVSASQLTVQTEDVFSVYAEDHPHSCMSGRHAAIMEDFSAAVNEVNGLRLKCLTARDTEGICVARALRWTIHRVGVVDRIYRTSPAGLSALYRFAVRNKLFVAENGRVRMAGAGNWSPNLAAALSFKLERRPYHMPYMDTFCRYTLLSGGRMEMGASNMAISDSSGRRTHLAQSTNGGPEGFTSFLSFCNRCEYESETSGFRHVRDIETPTIRHHYCGGCSENVLESGEWEEYDPNGPPLNGPPLNGPPPNGPAPAPEDEAATAPEDEADTAPEDEADTAPEDEADTAPEDEGQTPVFWVRSRLDRAGRQQMFVTVVDD